MLTGKLQGALMHSEVSDGAVSSRLPLFTAALTAAAQGKIKSDDRGSIPCDLILGCVSATPAG